MKKYTISFSGAAGTKGRKVSWSSGCAAPAALRGWGVCISNALHWAKVNKAFSLFYVVQHFGQYSRLTVAQALRIERKLTALHAILEGDASVENFTTLDEDWNIEERSLGALGLWGLEHVALSQPILQEIQVEKSICLTPLFPGSSFIQIR